MLQTVGVPTPDGRTVTSAEDAWEAAQEIGVPVVVKPQDGNFGRGVATNLTTREAALHVYLGSANGFAASPVKTLKLAPFTKWASSGCVVTGAGVCAKAIAPPIRRVGSRRLEGYPAQGVRRCEGVGGDRGVQGREPRLDAARFAVARCESCRARMGAQARALQESPGVKENWT